MDITSLSQKFNKNLQLSDPVCLLCLGSMDSNGETSQQSKNLSESMDPSSGETFSSRGNSGQASMLWNTVIVNQIPLNADREKLVSLFSQYGAIVDTYLCGELKQNVHKHERMARITFSNGDDAWKVLEASQRKLIKYDNHVLMITVVSDDYSPIQNLPNECIREIFLRLSSVADKFSVERVCKRWNAIGPQSWSSATTVSEYWPSSAWKTISIRAGDSLRDVKLWVRVEQFQDAGAGAEDFLKTLLLIGKYCGNLEGFMVSMDYEIWSNDRFNILYIPRIRFIISANECLRRLSLYWEEDPGYWSCIFPPGIEEIRLQASDPSRGFMHMKPLEISGFRNLQVLILSLFRIYDDQLRNIETLENLRVVSLAESEVHPSNLERFVNFTKLEYLAIPQCGATDEILSRILRNNKRLKYLDISAAHYDNSAITDRSLQHLCELQDLEVLFMQDLVKVENINLAAMPRLHTLNCSGCIRITDGTIQQLFSPNSVISRLYIADCSVTLESLKAAKEWVSQTGKSLKLFVAEELAEEWENSELKRSHPSTPDMTECLCVAVHQRGHRINVLPEDWDKYDLVQCDY